LESERTKYKMGLKTAKILYDYYILGLKQKDIAKKYGILQCSVSYAVRKYREDIVRIVYKCDNEYQDPNERNECYMRELRKVVIKKYGKHRKRKKRKLKPRVNSESKIY